MSKKVTLCGIDTSVLPKLTHQEARELMESVKAGDRTARASFIMCNLRLVLSVTQRYSSRVSSLDDIFQVGCVGLVKAVDNFNPVFNLKFSTYAVPMIIGEIRRFLRESSALHVSRSIRDLAYLALQAREELELLTDSEAKIEDIARLLDIPASSVKDALDAISEPISLYEPVFTDGQDSLMVMDQLDDKKNTDEKWLERVSLSEAVARLGDREKQIILKRYFDGKTQMEVSDEFGISQAQVSRLEKSAMEQMRSYL